MDEVLIARKLVSNKDPSPELQKGLNWGGDNEKNKIIFYTLVCIIASTKFVRYASNIMLDALTSILCSKHIDMKIKSL